MALFSMIEELLKHGLRVLFHGLIMIMFYIITGDNHHYHK